MVEAFLITCGCAVNLELYVAAHKKFFCEFGSIELYKTCLSFATIFVLTVLIANDINSGMDNAFLIKHLEQAQEHLRAMLDRHSQLETEQRYLECEIAKLTQDIAQLHEMCGEIPKDTESAKLSANIKEWGLTDAIRIVMKAADRALSAVDIRDRLKSIGFNTGQYQNDMATVSLTLQRMVKQGEIDPTVKKINGKTLYIWSPIGPNVKEIEIAFVNPPYAKDKERRYRVSPDPELIRQMMKKKSSKLELKKRK